MSRIIRLYTDHALKEGETIALTKQQAHYLRNVLRREIGDTLHFFNGQDGEWSGTLETLSKTNGSVCLVKQIKTQQDQTDLWVLCAPIKKDRFDFCIEKTVELGGSDFFPVYTHYTDIKRANIEKLSANAKEAAQQCGTTCITTVHPPIDLLSLIDQWETSRPLYICAERGTAPAFIDALHEQTSVKAAILIGPEGGFSDDELTILKQQDFVIPIHLGPLTLRTETALASAITLYQSVKGNWGRYKRD